MAEDHRRNVVTEWTCQPHGLVSPMLFACAEMLEYKRTVERSASGIRPDNPTVVAVLVPVLVGFPSPYLPPSQLCFGEQLRQH